MPRSATMTVLLLLLTAMTVPAKSRAGDNATQARQSFRVHVPGEVRIFATNYDTMGQPQNLRISAGMDISVALQNHSVPSVVVQCVWLVQEGRTVNIPVSQATDQHDDNVVTQITILPGW